jgi:predicted transcriptional regulator
MKKPNALRAYRRNKNLPADALAGMLGVHTATLRSYENGHRRITAEMSVKIERLLGIDRVLLRPDLFRKREAA